MIQKKKRKVVKTKDSDLRSDSEELNSKWE